MLSGIYFLRFKDGHEFPQINLLQNNNKFTAYFINLIILPYLAAQFWRSSERIVGQ